LVIKVAGDRLEIRDKHHGPVSDALRKKVTPYIAHVRKSEVVRQRDAIDYFTKYLKDHPKNDWALVLRGTAWANKGEYKNAFQDFDDAVHLKPTAWAFNARGRAWFERERFDRAIADFNEAIRLDPNGFVGYFNRGVALGAKKENDKAIKDFNEAIRLDPNDAASYHDRGLTRWRKQDLNKAISDLSGAVRLDPKNMVHFMRRGELFTGMKWYAKALADFDAAMPLSVFDGDPFDAAARIRATCSDAKIRNGKLAVDQAKAALSKSRDNPSYHETLAAAYAEAGDFDAAIRSQQEAVNWMWNQKKGFAEIFNARSRIDQYKQKKPLRDDGK
jgi:tetratricopeptide (TPR) repeat protein